ncbi:MAG: hemolysin family protein [Gemmatimonadota bacterium]
MDPDDSIISVLILLALTAASAFFVAVEFAVLTLRRRRVEQIARDDAGRIANGFSAAEQAEDISLVAQLGSLGCVLALGYFSADLAIVAIPGLRPAAAVAVAVAATAVVYLVVGQQIPRLLGAQRATWVAHPYVLLPLRALTILLRPVTALLSSLLDLVSGGAGLSRSAFYAPIHTLEDIRELVTQGHEQGVVEEDEREMIHGVFEFSDTVAREVMTPRIDIVAVPTEIGLAELIEVVVSVGHSRVPVYEETIDNIVGVLLAKDLLPLMAEADWDRERGFDVRRLMREPYFVPDAKPVDDILAEFRQSSVHIAIVIDEFGGTYGLVTMEDLLEEIVGEIKDEHDVEEPDFAPTPEGDVLIDGGASISEVNERYGLAISEEDFDTIGGFIFGALGRVPVPGDRVDGLGPDGTDFLEVEEAEDRRVTRVRLRRSDSVVTSEKAL